MTNDDEMFWKMWKIWSGISRLILSKNHNFRIKMANINKPTSCHVFRMAYYAQLHLARRGRGGAGGAAPDPRNPLSRCR